MKTFFRLAKSRGSLLLASAFVPLSVGLLVGGIEPTRRQSLTKSEIKIINKTKTLEVSAVHPKEPNMIVIQLKNISSKNLNGYEVDVHGKVRVTTDISAGDWAIPAGATHDIEFPAEYASYEIWILAAMFTDGSIEGDPEAVNILKERRLGLKTQLLRALPLLEAVMNSPDVDTTKALDRLEYQFSSLSVDANGELAHSASGSRSAKGDLISAVEGLRDRFKRHGALNQRSRLLELKRSIGRRIASL